RCRAATPSGILARLRLVSDSLRGPSFLPWGPGHLPAAEDVKVQVIDSLPAFWPAVDDHAVATCRHTGLTCDFWNHQPHVPQQRRMFGLEGIGRGDRLAGHNQDMC